LEDPVENEEECRAALNKLSQVKKYEISQLALQDLDVVKKYKISQLASEDLDVVGRQILGHNLKEKRLKQKKDRQKWIAQIHEAVAHFQSLADSRRDNLKAVSRNNHETEGGCDCMWEVEYMDILNRH
jgi:hypothetical protein